MLQDIGFGRFQNQFAPHCPEGGDRVLLYRGDSVLAAADGGQLALPRVSELPAPFRAVPLRYGFAIDGERYFYGAAEDTADPAEASGAGDSAPAGAAKDPAEEDGPFSFLPSREYRNMEPQEFAFACSVGESLHRWRRGSRFCGRCGAQTDDSKTERAVVCPACGLTVYPKICPAVIVAVCDGDRLLLTKYRGRTFKRYALVAGFSEIGETIEETVRREVLEETGLRVKNLQFYKSQPWVLTDSLLMGFFCQLDGEDRITLQEDELSVAQWFRREEIPTDHSGISLTGEMIEVYRSGGPLR